MAKKPRILLVCAVGWSRSQMAEGWLRCLGGLDIDVDSAGPAMGETDPFCSWAMNESGIDISNISPTPLNSKDLTSYSQVVILGKETEDTVKEMPEQVSVKHWDIPDPSGIHSRPADRIKAFRAVRNELERRVKKLLIESLELDRR